MIDVDKILVSIKPSFLELNEYRVEFEINSDECNGNLLLATVGEINYDLELTITDNKG